MSLRSKFKHSKVFILWLLSTDKLYNTNILFVFRNQRKNTYSCLNYYFSHLPSHCLNASLSNACLLSLLKVKVFFSLDEPESISFESNRTNNTVTVGNSITITCKADAFPSPNYTIIHNGENLKDVLNGVKTFKSVKLSDNGSYNCTAENVLGKESEDFILTVKSKICVKESLCAMVFISCIYLFIWH